MIDEAAAIPLPIVKSFLHSANFLVFLCSTVTGYEGIVIVIAIVITVIMIMMLIITIIYKY